MPKYYNDSRRESMQRYRKKRKTIQSTLTYKIEKKPLMEEQAAKRGLSMNAYFLEMMERDAKGMVYIIPDMNRREAVKRIREIERMDVVGENIIDSMLNALSENERAAVTELSADAAVDSRKILRTLLTCAGTEMTYTGVETIIESLEEYGADRDALLTAMRSVGIEPALPAQCVRSNIKKLEEED